MLVRLQARTEQKLVVHMQNLGTSLQKIEYRRQWADDGAAFKQPLHVHEVMEINCTAIPYRTQSEQCLRLRRILAHDSPKRGPHAGNAKGLYSPLQTHELQTKLIKYLAGLFAEPPLKLCQHL